MLLQLSVVGPLWCHSAGDVRNAAMGALGISPIGREAAAIATAHANNGPLPRAQWWSRVCPLKGMHRWATKRTNIGTDPSALPQHMAEVGPLLFRVSRSMAACQEPTYNLHLLREPPL
jgi:hypothetical protein